jgi:hypothetical protein
MSRPLAMHDIVAVRDGRFADQVGVIAAITALDAGGKVPDGIPSVVVAMPDGVMLALTADRVVVTAMSAAEYAAAGMAARYRAGE